MQKVFDFDDYVNFLNHWIKLKGKGAKRELAKLTNCSPTHISNVLNKKSSLTLDQAAKISKNLGLSKYETRYFFELVNYTRAGNLERKKISRDALIQIKEEWLVLSRCIGTTLEMSQEDFLTYLGSSFYMAIEILTSIPKYQTLESICRYFSLSEKKALDILDFLCKKNLVKKDGNKYVRGKVDMIFNPRNPSIKKNFYRIWRNKGIASLECNDENNLHLTQVLSISEKEKENLCKLIIERLSEIHSVCQKDEAEIITCINLDFFTVR